MILERYHPRKRYCRWNLRICLHSSGSHERLRTIIHPQASLYGWCYLCLCTKNYFIPSTLLYLVEWVGSGTPVGQEQAEADSLENAGDETNGNSVKRSLLSNNSSDELEKHQISQYSVLRQVAQTYTWSSRGEEDQWTKIRGSLVAQGSGCVDQSTNTICLKSRA